MLLKDKSPIKVLGESQRQNLPKKENSQDKSRRAKSQKRMKDLFRSLSTISQKRVSSRRFVDESDTISNSKDLKETTIDRGCLESNILNPKINHNFITKNGRQIQDSNRHPTDRDYQKENYQGRQKIFSSRSQKQQNIDKIGQKNLQNVIYSNFGETSSTSILNSQYHNPNLGGGPLEDSDRESQDLVYESQDSKDSRLEASNSVQKKQQRGTSMYSTIYLHNTQRQERIQTSPQRLKTIFLNDSSNEDSNQDQVEDNRGVTGGTRKITKNQIIDFVFSKRKGSVSPKKYQIAQTNRSKKTNLTSSSINSKGLAKSSMNISKFLLDKVKLQDAFENKDFRRKISSRGEESRPPKVFRQSKLHKPDKKSKKVNNLKLLQLYYDLVEESQSNLPESENIQGFLSSRGSADNNKFRTYLNNLSQDDSLSQIHSNIHISQHLNKHNASQNEDVSSSSVLRSNYDFSGSLQTFNLSITQRLKSRDGSNQSIKPSHKIRILENYLSKNSQKNKKRQKIEIKKQFDHHRSIEINEQNIQVIQSPKNHTRKKRPQQKIKIKNKQTLFKNSSPLVSSNLTISSSGNHKDQYLQKFRQTLNSPRLRANKEKLSIQKYENLRSKNRLKLDKQCTLLPGESKSNIRKDLFSCTYRSSRSRSNKNTANQPKFDKMLTSKLSIQTYESPYPLSAFLSSRSSKKKTQTCRAMTKTIDFGKSIGNRSDRKSKVKGNHSYKSTQQGIVGSHTPLSRLGLKSSKTSQNGDSHTPYTTSKFTATLRKSSRHKKSKNIKSKTVKNSSIALSFRHRKSLKDSKSQSIPDDVLSLQAEKLRSKLRNSQYSGLQSDEGMFLSREDSRLGSSSLTQVSPLFQEGVDIRRSRPSNGGGSPVHHKTTYSNPLYHNTVNAPSSISLSGWFQKSKTGNTTPIMSGMQQNIDRKGRTCTKQTSKDYKGRKVLQKTPKSGKIKMPPKLTIQTNRESMEDMVALIVDQCHQSTYYEEAYVPGIASMPSPIFRKKNGGPSKFDFKKGLQQDSKTDKNLNKEKYQGKKQPMSTRNSDYLHRSQTGSNYRSFENYFESKQQNKKINKSGKLCHKINFYEQEDIQEESEGDEDEDIYEDQTQYLSNAYDGSDEGGNESNSDNIMSQIMNPSNEADSNPQIRNEVDSRKVSFAERKMMIKVLKSTNQPLERVSKLTTLSNKLQFFLL